MNDLSVVASLPAVRGRSRLPSPVYGGGGTSRQAGGRGEPQTPAYAPFAHRPRVGHPPPTTLSRGSPSPASGRGSPTAALVEGQC